MEGKCGRDAGIVAHHAVFDRHIEVDAHQHTLALYIQILDRQFVHE